MLPCKEAKNKLSAHLDGELTGKERRELEAHLEACAACQAELELLGRLDKTFAALAEPAPAGLPEKVRRRLSPPAQPWRRSFALAASLVLGLLLGGEMTRQFYPAAVPVNGGETLAMEQVFNDFPQGSWGTAFVSYQEDEDVNA